jgi:hypothetical protein
MVIIFTSFFNELKPSLTRVELVFPERFSNFLDFKTFFKLQDLFYD